MDAHLLKVVAQGISLRRADNEQVNDVFRPWNVRQGNRQGREGAAVARSVLPSRLIPNVQLWKFDPENSRLYFVEPAVGSQDVVVVAA
jgi:hypothetical protein